MTHELQILVQNIKQNFWCQLHGNTLQTNEIIDLFEKVQTERKTTTKLTYSKTISIVVIQTAVS